MKPTPTLPQSVIDFADFLNEPPQYEDLRMVRDYRHEAWAKFEKVISDLSAALSVTPAKALEWRLDEEGWHIADTFFGGYRVERNPYDRWCWGVFFHGEAGIGLNSADNFEAAKDAAQDDFNERINSARSVEAGPNFRDLIIVGDTAYPVHSEVCRAFNELSAALSVPAEAVVGEPVAWTTQAQIDKFKVDPGCNAVMWGEPLPHHPDIPLYAAPSAPDGWQPIETAPKGPEILLFEQCDEMPATWVGRWFDPDFEDGYWTDTFDLKVAGHPTHWRPLPAPPALGGASHD